MDATGRNAVYVRGWNVIMNSIGNAPATTGAFFWWNQSWGDRPDRGPGLPGVVGGKRARAKEITAGMMFPVQEPDHEEAPNKI